MPKKRKRFSEAEVTDLRAVAVAALTTEGDYPKALRALDKIVAAGDKSCQCLVLRCATLLALAGDNPQSARLPKAVSDAMQLKSFDSTSPVGSLCLARALLAQGDPFTAEVECIRGIRVCLSLGEGETRRRSSAAQAPATTTKNAAGAAGHPVEDTVATGGTPGSTPDGAGDIFFWPGSAVKITGTSRDDLNGREGTVASYDGSKERFAVSLTAKVQQSGASSSSSGAATTATFVSFKAENLLSTFADAPAEFLPVSPHGARLALEACLKACRAVAEPRREQAEAVKAGANALFTSAHTDGDLQAAADRYAEAIELNPADAVLFSNRSACFAKLGKGATPGLRRCVGSQAWIKGDPALKKALADARSCVRLRPTWPKAHLRLGAALELLARPASARDAYKKGLLECYRLNNPNSVGALPSTDGQPLERHARGDALFEKLNEGFKRAAATARSPEFIVYAEPKT